MRVIQGGQSITSNWNIFDGVGHFIWYSWSRLFLYTLGYTGYLYFQVIHGDFLNLSVWQPLHIVMLIGFASHILFLEFCCTPQRQNTAVGVLAAVDLLLMAYALMILSAYLPVYLLSTLLFLLVAGLFLGLQKVIRVTLFAISILAVVLALNPYFESGMAIRYWGVAFFSTMAVGILSGLLGDQIRSAQEDLGSQKIEIESLKNVNDLIVENIPSGLMIIDKDFNILKANPGAKKILSDLSLESRRLNEVSVELEVLMRTHQETDRKPAQKHHRYEVKHRDLNKETVHLEVIVSEMPSTHLQTDAGVEQNTNYILLLQNMTEIKRMQMAMQQKEKLAAVGQLAAGIAHEIRNPLASISGSVQLLQGNLAVQSDEDKKLLSIMIKEIDRLNRLISEFLDFVRPEALVEDPIQINVLMREILDIVKLNDKLSRKVEQRTELRAEGLMVGQYDKLKQALLNIVINAYQAMGNTLRPELVVRTQDLENSVELTIQDNGIGMSADTKRRLFEPFHTTKPQGTGLGLAIAHKILEVHGAKMHIESELGEGAKFVFTFPAQQGPHKKEIRFKKNA